MQNTSPHRRGFQHRKRVSALRLSSDTTLTLPEYNPVSNWQRQQIDGETEDDRPPEYDSAEEADEESDPDDDRDPRQNNHYLPSPPLSAPIVSRRGSQLTRRAPPRRKEASRSSTDLYLDSLLERSVHALEMSNALLQSSITTNTSLSTILGSENAPADSRLQARAVGLSRKIRRSHDMRDAWMEDLNDIKRGVEDLFEEDGSAKKRKGAHAPEGSVSSSLPSGSGLAYRHSRRRSSADLRDANSGLSYAPQARNRLISPAPRALTQYVAADSSHDGANITLPSTLGLRAAPSAHSATPSTSKPKPPPLPSTSRRRERTEGDSDSTAYERLASFVYRPGNNAMTSPDSSTSPPQRRGSSNRSTERLLPKSSPVPGSSRTSSRDSRGVPSPHRSPAGFMDFHPLPSPHRSRSSTPKRAPSPPPPPPTHRRCMTPPTEESSVSSSSDSSDSVRAKLTVESLRKILQEQPANASTLDDAWVVVDAPERRPPPPKFLLPRSPPPPAEAATSTATASISRLFTKAQHSSSTRAPSPPKISSFKGKGKERALNDPSAPTTPTLTHVPSSSSIARDFERRRTPSTLSVSDMVGVAVALSHSHSQPNSGVSTPKRISFAELPESYGASRPAGSGPSTTRRKKRRDKGKEETGWWSSWFGGLSYGDRMEERMMGRGRVGIGLAPSSGLDDWTI
ncbi:hypothetical protein K523DRAFT_357199 [Schizophyllum commune Tattone D]|nr:hypothetical protein K523DRAFT_357199 [Schizophyllum commune Tattone D]